MSSIVDLLLKIDKEVLDSSEKQIEEFKKRFSEFEKFYTNLKPKEKVVLTSYITSGYFVMNKFLYSDDIVQLNINSYVQFLESVNERKFFGKLTSFQDLTDHFAIVVQKSIRELDQIFLKAPRLKTSVILYRGVSLSKENVNKILDDGEITFKNFISTSPFSEFSMSFALGENGKNIAVMFEIDVKKNTRFIPNSKALEGSINEQWGDEEIIFPRNIRFKIVSWKIKNVKSVDEKTLKEVKYNKSKLYFIKLQQIGTPTKSDVLVKDIKRRINFVVDITNAKNSYTIINHDNDVTL